MFSTEQQQYVAADVVVQRVNGDYVVLLNDEQIPHLRISNTYKELMAQRRQAGDAKEYIRDKIRAGKFLIKSIHQRQQTIYNIAKVIVERQREFLDKGISFLRPLTMAQVAEVVGVHETTVSRAVANKYMQTPQGLFEMKYFFTPGFETASGGGDEQHQRQGTDFPAHRARRHRPTAVRPGDRGDPQGKGHPHRPPHGGQVPQRIEHPPEQSAQAVLIGRSSYGLDRLRWTSNSGIPNLPAISWNSSRVTCSSVLPRRFEQFVHLHGFLLHDAMSFFAAADELEILARSDASMSVLVVEPEAQQPRLLALLALGCHCTARVPEPFGNCNAPMPRVAT